MGYYANADDRREGGLFPAYGPIDSLLSFVVFYVFVDRATPTVVEVFTDIAGVSASAVEFATAAFLWFILVVTLVDIVRRQFAAVGMGSQNSVEQVTRQRGVPSTTRMLVYAAVVVVGGAVASLTFERAVDAGITMFRIVGTLDVTGFDVVSFVVMVLFFVSFGAATRALDRLVIGVVRAVVAG
ncbi:hypothetical protein [Haloferax sp. YSSS75]|uniref:hypothetical protein n=1 Tax=Haloferax sp. YSSS75 TaxID=3388564 RepID=UPI00398D4D2D